MLRILDLIVSLLALFDFGSGFLEEFEFGFGGRWDWCWVDWRFVVSLLPRKGKLAVMGVMG